MILCSPQRSSQYRMTYWWCVSVDSVGAQFCASALFVTATGCWLQPGCSPTSDHQRRNYATTAPTAAGSSLWPGCSPAPHQQHRNLGGHVPLVPPHPHMTYGPFPTQGFNSASLSSLKKKIFENSWPASVSRDSAKINPNKPHKGREEKYGPIEVNCFSLCSWLGCKGTMSLGSHFRLVPKALPPLKRALCLLGWEAKKGGCNVRLIVPLYAISNKNWCNLAIWAWWFLETPSYTEDSWLNWE